MTEDLIEQFGYLGIVLLLVLGGLGLPVPEEAPIILAAILTRKGAMWGPMAFGACVVGVLLGDFVVYGLGYVYGERVLAFRLTRKLLTRAREAQIKGYFQRHGLKILIVGRFAVGFRTAAYLTAGILRHPPLKLLMTDLFAVMLSTPLMFGLGYFFARQIEEGIREVQHSLALVAAGALVLLLLVRSERARRRGGRPVGPPVLEGDEAPLPPADVAPARPSSPAAPQVPRPGPGSAGAGESRLPADPPANTPGPTAGAGPSGPPISPDLPRGSPGPPGR
ncbi:DedA family protein [Tautonia plasticadhaerens]|uniref:VTT domain-containing protein n=1 Tax=Tautonia plasticadhaerens TaxID=2527974 RepID=A0A518GX72_9BACT|nr:DedA family protein [Tautonia plasticadhaerens]QDV33180.1 hypothetical protein ElP_10220 [Tautonia plasticadhaerens]